MRAELEVEYSIELELWEALERRDGHWLIDWPHCSFNTHGQPTRTLKDGRYTTVRAIMRAWFYPKGGHKRQPCPHRSCVHPDHRYSKREAAQLSE